MHLKQLKEKKGVFVEEKKEEVDMQATNVMGLGQSISQKQLTELYAKLKELQESNENSKKDLSLKATQMKAQITKIRDEKLEVEKKLFDTEFALTEKETHISQLKDEKASEVEKLQTQVTELTDKVEWFRSNQKLLSADESEQRDAFKKMQELQEQVDRSKDDKKRLRELEKKCKLLQETVQSKDPNSLQLLIAATKAEEVEDTGKHEMKGKITRLEEEMEFQAKEHEKKILSLRQEMEKIRQHYESKLKQATDSAKRPAEAPLPKSTRRPPSARSTTQQQPQPGQHPAELENIELREQVDRLREKCNHLAQKVVNQEHRISAQRRPSFGSGVGSIPASPKLSEKASPSANRDIKDLFYQNQSEAASPTQKSPNDKLQISSSKRLNPFESANDSKERGIPQLIKLMSKQLGDLSMFGKAQTVKTNKFYTICNDMNVKVSLEEVKRLVHHLDNLRDTDEATFLDKDDDAIDLVQLRNLLNPQSAAPEATTSEMKRLIGENKRLRAMLEDEDGFNDIKIQKLRSEIADSEMDKRNLKVKVDKLEA